MKTVLLVALNAAYQHTNLAVRQIAQRVVSPWRARILERHINLPYRSILADIAGEKADAVGFSCYLWNRDMCLRLANALRKIAPETLIYFGGPEAENDADTFEKLGFPVSRGEGETTVMPFLTGAPAPTAPLDPADWPDVYAGGIEGLENRILYLETSRGCPYRCGYCLSAGTRVRALDAKEAARRMIALADGGAKLIKLVDRTFNFDRARANEIWRALIERENAHPTGVRYHFEIAANLIDDESIAVLARAPKGLFQFEAGIQSTNAPTLKAVGRAADNGAVFEGARRVLELGTIPLHVDLIAGLPEEDLTAFERSFDDAFALGADMLQLGFLKLLPGSRLRRDADALGLVYDPAPPYEVLRTPAMSYDDLCFLHEIERALDFYSPARYPLATRYLLGSCTPFRLFARLAEAMRSADAFHRELGEKARAEILASLSDAICAELVAHDLLARGLRREIPERLRREEDAELRARLREKYRPLRGQSARRYPFDVAKFSETGRIEKRETILFYD